MADKVLGTLTMDDLSALRKLSPPDAELFLARHILTPDERARADQLVGRDKPKARQEHSIQIHDPLRSLWMTAAWLAGASWRQLARFHGIAPQTVMSSADRRLTSYERQAQRIRAQMSLESLDAYHKTFTGNYKIFSLMTPQEVAQWLIDHTELDNEV